MGISIVAQGKDFSSLGLGNVNLSEKYIAAAGITNSTQKTAIRNFYNAFKAAGFFQKFNVAKLYFGGTALADSINLIDPVIGTGHYQTTFQNDNSSYHTSSGWTPNAGALHVGKSNFPILGDVNNLHIHAWNVTSENPASSGVFKYLMGANANTVGVNEFTFYLSRNAAGRTRGVAGGFSTKVILYAAPGYDLTKTGLLSFSRQASGVHKLYDGGVSIATQTVNDAWYTNGATMLYEGNLDAITGPGVTDAKMRFIGMGFSTWTDADEVALKTMIEAFNTAVA